MAREAQRVLGVDPSLRGTGLAVIEVVGDGLRVLALETVRNPTSWPHTRCLGRILEAIQRLIGAQGPSEAAIESPFVGRSYRTALVLGEARGVVLAACAVQALPVYEYAPREVKLALTGRGSATKEQVQRMLRAWIGAAPTMREDEADAIAVALCHAHRARHPILGRPPPL